MEELIEYILRNMDPEDGMEGSADESELRYLTALVESRKAKKIGEIGFNSGISSYAFLEANPETRVISFDIGDHSYVKYAKEYIDKKFPGRHTLILGNSNETVPKFAAEHPGYRFDLIFIDGSHEYETARRDLINMQRLASPKTALVMDDLTPWLEWGLGPTQAWTEAIRDGLVAQEELVKDGRLVAKIAPPGQRSWALAHYTKR